MAPSLQPRCKGEGEGRDHLLSRPGGPGLAEDMLGEQAGITQTGTATRGSWGLTTPAPTCCPSAPVCAQIWLLPSPPGKQCQRGQEVKSRGQALPAASRSQDLPPSELWPHCPAPFQEVLHWQTGISPNFTPFPPPGTPPNHTEGCALHHALHQSSGGDGNEGSAC